jgi:protein O-mannosyl-transferase
MLLRMATVRASRRSSAPNQLRKRPGALFGGRITGLYRSHPNLCFAVFSALWVLVLYRHAFRGAFVYDDIPQIQQNSALLTWHGTLAYFHSSVPFNNEFRGLAGSFYRPLFWLSLALDRRLWGLNPSGFHLSNLALHWANGLLGFLLVRRFSGSLLLGSAASLLWLSLPINTEVVAWISGRSFSLMGLLLLLSLLVADGYLRSRKPAFLIYYFVGALGALLSHEAGVLVLPLTILVAYARDRKPGRSWLPLAATGIGVALVYAGLRYFAGAQMPPVLPAVLPIGISFLKYVQWMLLPVHMSVERSTDLPRNNFSFAAVGALVLVTALFVLIFRLRNTTPRLAAGLAWMSTALLPFCGLVFIYQGMAERYSYVASEGLALAIAALALRYKKRARPAILSLVAVWTLWGVWRLNARVLDWSNEVSLYSTSLEATPKSAVLLYNLGLASGDAGDSGSAIDYYQRAITINPGYVSAIVNLGNVFRSQGQYGQAISLYRRAISLDPQSADPWIDLGNAYAQQGSPQQARSAYETAIRLNPDDTRAIINLGAALQSLGNLSAAKQQYERAIAIDPKQAAVYCDLGALLVQEEKGDAAIKQFTKAIDIDPSYAPAYFDLGVLYQRAGRNDLAVEMYQKALEIKPDYERARLNLESLQGKR